MGYTHYWNSPTTIAPTTFTAISDELTRLLPALEQAGSPLANTHGREQPEIGAELIAFNGVEFCGHAKNPAVVIPWPMREARGIGDNAGVGGSLPYRTCNGNCSYESVWFKRVERDGTGFCKTAFRPDDLAVTAFLVIAKHHLGALLTVETDGEPAHWANAFALCQAGLGFGERSLFKHGKLVLGEVTPCA